MDAKEYFRVLSDTQDLMWRESLLGELKTNHPSHRGLTPIWAVALKKLGSTSRVTFRDADRLGMDLDLAKRLDSAGWGSDNDYREATLEATQPAPMYLNCTEVCSLTAWIVVLRGLT